jgi:multidrug efflux pump subunit AcrB
MALAVGILVDDATVAIENINRYLETGAELEQSILNGSAQIATPALVSTLSICIVFVPMFFLTGVARYLFVPMAEAVVFAMLASFLLSRTLVPTMAKYLLLEHDDVEVSRKHVSRNPFVRFQHGFENGFEHFRHIYLRLLTLCLDNSRAFLILFMLFAIASLGLTPFLGQDFFPSVDSGQFKIHVRARTGTRLEETAQLCDQVDATIREQIPAKEVVNIVDTVGLPASGINLAYSTSAPVGTADADIQVQLAEKHHPTAAYVEHLRAVLNQEYPGVTFYVLPVDIVTQILNFGLSSPIDLQIVGPNQEGNRALANRILNEVRYVPGAADAHIQQPSDLPKMTVNVDRTRAQMIGLTQKDVDQSLLIALSGSFQTSPTFFLDPKNGVSYNVTTQAPQYGVDSVAALQGLPITGSSTTQTANDAASTGAPGAANPVQILGNLAEIEPGTQVGTVSHYDVQPVLDIYSNVDGTDLGTVTRKMEKIIDRHKAELPRGSHFTLRGQSETMKKSYMGLLIGLVFSILLVYLLIVVNFQSWLDPFLIISALPAALAGIVWFLFLTNTRLSVPALTGAIMCMGVATSNSILVVTFAREQLEALVGDARKAALNAGFVRLRPVLMTALAMIIGMIPMALGLGDGGEQNAPLGRAVIGGLLVATVATLFFVPTFFSVVHGWLESRRKTVHAVQLADTFDEFDENPE